MMIVRLIILTALIGLIIFAYRKLTGIGQSAGQQAPQPSSMKKCAHCGVHLPETDAVKHDDLFFCSPEHKSAFLERHSNDGD